MPDAPRAWPGRRSAIEALAVATAVMALHAAFRLSDAVVVGAFSDDAVYVALGRSLADGTGYRSVYLPGEPIHLKYPPGLPLTIAPLWQLGGSLPAVMQLHGMVTLLLAGLTSGLLWWLARQELRLPLGVALPVVLTPFLLESWLEYFHLALSEPYFVCLWVAAVVAYAAVRHREAGSSTSGRAAAIGLGLSVGAAALFRTQGVVLIPVLLAVMAFDRFRRATIFLAGAAAVAPMALWHVARRAMAAGGTAASQLDELGYTSWLPGPRPAEIWAFVERSLSFNGPRYWGEFAGSLAPWPLVGNAMAIVVVVAAAIGAYAAFRRQPWLLWSVVSSAIVIALWPWPQDRFLVTLLPLVGLLAGYGIARLTDGLRPRVAWGRDAALAMALVVIGVRQVELRRSAFAHSDPRPALGTSSPGYVLVTNSRYLIAAAEWITVHTAPDDRVLSFSPAAIYLLTGRQAVTADPAEPATGPSVFATPGRYLAGRILEDGISVVPEDGKTISRELQAVETMCPGSVQLAGTTEGLAAVPVYRVTRQEACLRRQVLGPP